MKAAKNLTSSPRVFEFLVSQYGGKSGRLDEKILDTILEEINSTIGQGLTKKPVSIMFFLRVLKKIMIPLLIRPNWPKHLMMNLQ